MQVQELMTTEVISVAPEDSAAVAARLLGRHNIGALPVCGADRRVVGMVTDRDLALRCVASGVDARQIRVQELMSSRVISVTPETDVTEASALMGREQVRRLPVCTHGRLVGMLSLGDLVRRDQTEAAEAMGAICRNLSRR